MKLKNYLVVRIILIILILSGFIFSIYIFLPNKTSSVARMTAQSVVALGISWQSESNRNYTWLGTGFAVSNRNEGVTAGHVIIEMYQTYNDLIRRDLEPAYHYRLSDGTIGEIERITHHPSLLSREKDDIKPHPLDLGLFDFGELRPSRSIEISKKNPEIGHALVAVGFPDLNNHGLVLSDKNNYNKATVKFGHIENLLMNIDMKNIELIQHGLALSSGFSGSPLVDKKGRLVAIANSSSHLIIKGTIPGQKTTQLRVLNPADINFAVPATSLTKWKK